MIRLVALDLDGTLLGGTKPHYGIREEAIKALHDAHRHGVLLGIVTGRDFPFICDMLLQHGIDPGVSAFPSVIIAEERFLFTLESGAYRPDTEWNERIEREERQRFPLISDIVRHLLETELRRFDPDVKRMDEIEERRGYIELVFSTREAAEAGAEMLAKACSEPLPEVVPIRNGRGVCLRHVRASKGAVLKRYADAAEIAPEHILAVGDSENDRSMLDGRYGFQAGTMSNADERIRQLVLDRGGRVAQGACGLGVAQLIESLLPPADDRAGA